MIKNILEALYKNLQVSEERKSCPRPGIYKLLSAYQGICYEKPALMAECHWRTTTADDYQTDFKATIQLESFKKNATEEQIQLLNSQDLIGREIDVFNVADMGEKGLDVSWKFVEQTKISLDKLNELLSNGALGEFDIDQFDDYSADDGDIDFEPEV